MAAVFVVVVDVDVVVVPDGQSVVGAQHFHVGLASFSHYRVPSYFQRLDRLFAQGQFPSQYRRP